MINLLDRHIPVTRNRNPRSHPRERDLKFDKHFSPHMLLCNWSSRYGWTNPRIVPYANISIPPSAPILNYGAGAFDGLEQFFQHSAEALEASEDREDCTAFFRLDMHCNRLPQSAHRMCLPCPSPTFLHKACLALARIDHSWVPRRIGTALYYRPLIIGTEGFVGHRRTKKALLCIYTSPVGSYFKKGKQGIDLRIEEHYTRAAPGGVGPAKNPGSYGAALLPAEEAQAAGFDHVLFTDVTHQFIDEAGTTSWFGMTTDGEVFTPALSGTILRSVMRDTNIHLLRSWGFQVNERPVAVEEIVQAWKDHRLQECWCTGTAGGVQANLKLGFRGTDMVIGDNTPGPVTRRLQQAVIDHRYGRVPDEYGWRTVVER